MLIFKGVWFFTKMLNTVNAINPGYDTSNAGAKNAAMPLKSNSEMKKDIAVVPANITGKNDDLNFFQ